VTFARADTDQDPANGVDILEFKQAIAREIEAKAAEDERVVALGPPIIVECVFGEYASGRVSINFNWPARGQARALDWRPCSAPSRLSQQCRSRL
jgi:hypothetical protein